MTPAVLLRVGLLATLACSTKPPHTASAEAPITVEQTMTGTWRITYSDAAMNVYRVQTVGDVVRYSYEPMTPERSSSGAYDGGEPQQGTLTVRQWHELRTRLSTLANATERHVPSRSMGTSAIWIEHDNRPTSFYVPNHDVKEVDQLLRQVLHPPTHQP